MMAITRVETNPFREFATLQDRLNRMFGDNIYVRDEDVSGRPGWIPAVDIYETEGHDLVVKAELPGMEKENIEVNLSDHTLTIKGEKKKEEEIKEENYYRAERSYGGFLRTLELPKDVHADKVKASFKNGILEVRMPKTEEAKAKEVKVKVE